MTVPPLVASWAFLLLALVVKPSSAFFMFQPKASSGFAWRSPGQLHRTLYASSRSIDMPTDQVPNEFSRPLNTDRILKTSAGKQRRSHRNYQISIEATNEECNALAQRFDLKGLASLQADLTLTPPPGGGTNLGGLLTVQVEGNILAHLTQTCVRTNEDFEVDVEVPVSCIVKPIAASSQFNIDDLFGADGDSMGDNEFQSQRSAGKTKKKSTSLRADRLNNLNDMMELQQMIDLQENENDYSLDEMIEDESIYSLNTGYLDVGELVSQTFWLNLDPYPKKPGSGPMEFSISG